MRRHAEIDVYVRTVPACCAESSCGEDVLTADERQRAEMIRPARKRAEFVAGRTMIRQVLSATLGVEPRTLSIAGDENGRPRLAGEPGIDFNLAHSHGLGLLAVARHARVAVDVEKIRPERAHAAIEDRFFTIEERAQIEATPPAVRQEAFYDIWTCKEAYVKALGVNFFTHLQTVSVAPSVGRVLRGAGNDDPSRWRLQVLSVADTHRASVCWEVHDEATYEVRVHDERR